MTTSENISIHLTPELRLEQALIQAGVKDPASVTGLSFTGMLTEDDFLYIRKKMGTTLQELDISNASVEEDEILKHTFFNCTGLISIHIPDTIYWIIDDMFNTCNNLKTITIHPDNPNYSSDNGLLFNKDKNVLLFCPRGREGDFTVPDGVVHI